MRKTQSRLSAITSATVVSAAMADPAACCRTTCPRTWACSLVAATASSAALAAASASTAALAASASADTTARIPKTRAAGTATIGAAQQHRARGGPRAFPSFPSWPHAAVKLNSNQAFEGVGRFMSTGLFERKTLESEKRGDETTTLLPVLYSTRTFLRRAAHTQSATTHASIHRRGRTTHAFAA